MYGHEGSATLASTGTGIIIAGQYISPLKVASVIFGGTLIVVAGIIAFRRSRRGR